MRRIKIDGLLMSIDEALASHGGYDMDDHMVRQCVVCGAGVINPVHNTCRAHRN